MEINETTASLHAETVNWALERSLAKMPLDKVTEAQRPAAEAAHAAAKEMARELIENPAKEVEGASAINAHKEAIFRAIFEAARTALIAAHKG